MLENFYSNFKNYWKDIDQTIFLSFLLLFILGIFFSFASTSLLAGEKLNKDYYFFFSKHLIFHQQARMWKQKKKKYLK